MEYCRPVRMRIVELKFKIKFDVSNLLKSYTFSFIRLIFQCIWYLVSKMIYKGHIFWLIWKILNLILDQNWKIFFFVQGYFKIRLIVSFKNYNFLITWKSSYKSTTYFYISIQRYVINLFFLIECCPQDNTPQEQKWIKFQEVKTKNIYFLYKTSPILLCGVEIGCKNKFFN